MKKIVIVSFLLIFLGCNSEEIDVVLDHSSVKTTIKYAKGFTIKQFESYRLITLNNPWKGEQSTFKYVLYSNEKPKGIDEAIFIKTPIKSIACMSLTHVAFIEKLGLENSIVALSGCDYVSSSKVKSLIAKKSIKEIGIQQNTNYEMLVEESPDFIMGYGIDASSNGQIDKLNTLGLSVVLNSEYMETTPLGKAEWIKFVAEFYNEGEKAEIIFSKVEKEYLSLLELTKLIEKKPTVFVGMPWNGVWYVPGAKSFQAQLLRDAGAQYLWLDNEEQSSLVKAKEVIIDEAYNADFWLNQNSYSSMKDILAFDEKFTGFHSIKEHQLYNNDKRTNSASGNDYWESGVISPEVVLKDLIEVFHPELLDHELYYYRNLE